TVMMWVRWTLPRLRIDQVMTTCLKYCVPLAAICFVGAMIWKLNDWPSVHDFAPQAFGYRFADVREDWGLQKGSGVRGQGSGAEDMKSAGSGQRSDVEPLTYSPLTPPSVSSTVHLATATTEVTQ